MTTTIERPIFRPFTDQDWLAFGGADPFDDGSDPITAEGVFANGRSWLVAMAPGGALLVLPDEGGAACFAPREFAGPAEAEGWFLGLLRAGALADLAAAGFEPV